MSLRNLATIGLGVLMALCIAGLFALAVALPNLMLGGRP